MGAAIPLLLPLFPPEAELPQGDAESSAGEEFALALELATLPPELRPQSAPDGLTLGPQLAKDGAETLPANVPAREGSVAGPSLASIASEASAATASAPNPSPVVPAPTQPEAQTLAAAPAPAPIARPEVAAPDPAATRAADPEPALTETEVAKQPRPDSVGTAAANPTPEGAPRATRPQTVNTDLRTHARAPRAAAAAAAAADPNHAIREFVPGPAESEAQGFQPAPPSIPVTAHESAPAPPTAFATAATPPPLPAVGGTGEIARSELSSPPVPPEGLPLQIEWLAERGGGRARIQLHPPHLGHVELEVRTRGSEVEVILNVGESAAHAPLQAQRQPLMNALAALDLDLASFEVADREGSERRSQQQDPQHAPENARKQSQSDSNDASPDLAHTSQPAQRSHAVGIDVRI